MTSENCITTDAQSSLLRDEFHNALLQAARNGDTCALSDMLQSAPKDTVLINATGLSKVSQGWAALHLVVFFDHIECARVLLMHGADVNVLAQDGDTPLHKAAYTNRNAMVRLLIDFGADASIKNFKGYLPISLTNNKEIKEMLQATALWSCQQIELAFLRAAREGDDASLSEFLKGPKRPNLHCTDLYGNTALHLSVNANNTAIVILLLQQGFDTSLRNGLGLSALDLAKSATMKQLLTTSLPSVRDLDKIPTAREGFLQQKGRFRNWRTFLARLEGGILVYFRCANASSKSGLNNTLKINGDDECKTITLVPSNKAFFCRQLNGARVSAALSEPGAFMVRFSDGTKHALRVLISTNLVEKQKWISALDRHIEYSEERLCDNFGVPRDYDHEDIMPLGTMMDNLHTAEAHQQIIEEQTEAVTKLVQFTENDDISTDDLTAVHYVLRPKFRAICSAAKEACDAMRHCLNVIVHQEELRALQLHQAKERVRVLEESLQIVAAEQHQLETSLRRTTPKSHAVKKDNLGYDGGASSENEEFYDCFDEELEMAFHKDRRNSLTSTSFCEHVVEKSLCMRNNSNQSVSADIGAEELNATNPWGGRFSLPAVMRSRNEISVWNILKHAIGQELSKMTMPVNINEPLSFLQRMAEYLEFSHLIFLAEQCSDPIRRMEYVAAFAVSAASSNSERLGKPFNPLLGETYELDRRADRGFRMVCEQVCHRPPVSAFYAESASGSWQFFGSIRPKLAFWGKAVNVDPKGGITLKLLNHGETYTWQNVQCNVHNIIFGQLWIEHCGNMEIVNHEKKLRAELDWKAVGWTGGKDAHRIEGYIYDEENRKVRAIYGKWIEALYSVDVDVWKKFVQSARQHKKHSHTYKNHDTTSQDGPLGQENGMSSSSMVYQPIGSNGVSSSSDVDLKLADQICLWQVRARPPNSGQYYNFTYFAMQLNEMPSSLTNESDTATLSSSQLAPTDSRLRPDIRALEEGRIEDAKNEKNRLEEKQRACRQERLKINEEWQPMWFRLTANEHSGKEEYSFDSRYWSRDWRNTAQIF